MLYTEKIKSILEKLGVDVSTLPDNLYTTLLDACYEAVNEMNTTGSDEGGD